MSRGRMHVELTILQSYGEGRDNGQTHFEVKRKTVEAAPVWIFLEQVGCSIDSGLCTSYEITKTMKFQMSKKL